MEFNEILVSAGRAVFDDKYTRENNPEVYFENIDLSNKNINSLDGFPKIISSEYVDLSSNCLSDLRGFPKFQSDEVAKKCSLKLSKNPIISLEGSPDYIYAFDISDCSKLASLQDCPKISGYINITGCKSLKKLDGCKTSPPKISIIANRSGLESLEGYPEEVDNLIITGCNNRIISDVLEKKAARVDVTISPPYLSELHEKFHQNKSVGIVNLFSDDKGYEEMVELSCRLRETSDPFEFQDWCLDHGFEEYL